MARIFCLGLKHINWKILWWLVEDIYSEVKACDSFKLLLVHDYQKLLFNLNINENAAIIPFQ